MAEFDFNEIMVEETVQWPKRGRKPKPLDPNLVKVLHDSFINGTVPHLVMPNQDVKAFGFLLNGVGGKLNMRIERHVEVDTPEPGKSTFHFRVRSKRNKDLDD